MKKIFSVLLIISLFFVSFFFASCGKNKDNETYYTIRLDSNGGSVEKDNYVVKEGTRIELEIPVYEGYNFVGWYDGSIKIGDNYYIATKNVTLVAHWETKKYSISFDVNGGEALAKDKISLSIGEYYVLPTPVRNGYSFAGWYYKDELITDGVWNMTKDIKVVAKWSEKELSIQFDVAGGNPLKENKVYYAYNDPITLPTPEFSGYTFDGWYLSNELFTKTVFDFNESIVLIAHWKANNYKISFNSDGGNKIDSITVKYNDNIVLPIPKKTGYDFSGWYLDDEKINDGNYKISRDATLTAHWEAKSFTISFDVNGGYKLQESQMTVLYGSEYSLPIPRREGCQFEYWYNIEGKLENGTWNKLKNVLVYAKWKVIDVGYTGNDYNTKLLEDGTLEITKYLGNNPYVEIPNIINGKIVTKIGDSCVRIKELGKV